MNSKIDALVTIFSEDMSPVYHTATEIRLKGFDIKDLKFGLLSKGNGYQKCIYTYRRINEKSFEDEVVILRAFLFDESGGGVLVFTEKFKCSFFKESKQKLIKQ
jgi:hypothetical protein